MEIPLRERERLAVVEQQSAYFAKTQDNLKIVLMDVTKRLDRAEHTLIKHAMMFAFGAGFISLVVGILSSLITTYITRRF